MESIKYNEIEVKIDYENYTIWLTQNQISKLFNISQAKVSKNINAITKSWNKLSPTYSKLEYVQMEGDRKVTRNVKVYNLEIIRVIGYKINSDIINDFIKWVEELFKDYSSKNAILMQKGYEIVTFIDDELQIDVNVDVENDTVWLTQNQMAFLFQTTIENINIHIKNILKDSELDSSVIKDSLITAQDRKKYYTKLYNLDMIISVGYRVKSKRGIMFRKWATNILNSELNENEVVRQFEKIEFNNWKENFNFNKA